MLAEKYGTPLYLVDYGTLRENCRRYKEYSQKYFGGGCRILYASKALSYVDIYRVMKEEEMYIDTVSGGEIYTVNKAGYPMDRVYFHGNNKTDRDIEYASDIGVGCFVADNKEELDALDAYCKKTGRTQKILLRLSPGIDAHTFKAVVTGTVDSKFGTAIATGQAMEIVKYALSLKNLDFAGIHCHIGSQIFETEPFCDAMKIMLGFVKEIRDETGVVVRELNIGGGPGVQYDENDPKIDFDVFFSGLASVYDALCKEYGIEKPTLLMEPGRSIVADAGITLYTVGTHKTIKGYKSYVSIDGGMPDNPRYALYKSKYDFVIANKADKEKDDTVTVAGRCCESGDMLGEQIRLQRAERGDILAVLVTGAYNYSMASNYNRLPRPAIVAVEGGSDRIVVKRESYEDLCRNEI